jgi:formiminoglutamase
MGALNNIEYGVDLRELAVVDAGDVAEGQPLEVAHEELRGKVRAALDRGAIPFVVGGSNDQSAPNGMALLDHLKQGADNAAIVNIDAHLDVRPRVALPDGRLAVHSGSPFRELLEDGRMPGANFVEFAAQGSQCSAEHVAYVTAHGGSVVWLNGTRTDPSDAPAATPAAGGALPSFDFTPLTEDTAAVASFRRHVLQRHAARELFVSFDIDSITGADCPGVSAPASAGLSAAAAMRIALESGASPNVRLMDVSEMNPVVEGYRTPRLAVNIFYYFLMGVCMRKRAFGRLLRA